MGLIDAEIELINPGEDYLRPLKARAMFDSGAMTLCIPETAVVKSAVPKNGPNR